MNEEVQSVERRQPPGGDATALDEVADTVGLELLKRMHMELVQLQSPWQNTPEERQQEILDRLRTSVTQAIGHAVRRIAGGGFAHVAVSVDSLSVKSDEAKATISVPRRSPAMHDLADMVGQAGVLVFVDEQAYIANMHHLKAAADQPELPLEEPVENRLTIGLGETAAA